MSVYGETLRAAMAMLAGHGAIFVGQAVEYPGTAMYATLAEVPAAQRVELPVFENTQLGMCTGIALVGGLPVAIYPRINFLLEATSQFVQHLDKIPLYSGFRPRVIIRTAVATREPLNPGPQHLGDYSFALEQMLCAVTVVRLTEAEQIVPAYELAAAREGSTVLVEYSDRYT